MPEQKDLPKPLTDLPAGRQDLPKPEKDLPPPHSQVPNHSQSEQADKTTSPSTPSGNANSTSQKKSKRNKKLFGILLLIFLIILILSVSGYLFLGKSSSSSTDSTLTPEPVVCAQEAMLCPDGKTYVSREAPNCEFAKCPEIQETMPENAEVTPIPSTPSSTSSPTLQ